MAENIKTSNLRETIFLAKPDSNKNENTDVFGAIFTNYFTHEQMQSNAHSMPAINISLRSEGDPLNPTLDMPIFLPYSEIKSDCKPEMLVAGNLISETETPSREFYDLGTAVEIGELYLPEYGRACLDEQTKTLLRSALEGYPDFNMQFGSQAKLGGRNRLYGDQPNAIVYRWLNNNVKHDSSTIWFDLNNLAEVQNYEGFISESYKKLSDMMLGQKELSNNDIHELDKFKLSSKNLLRCDYSGDFSKSNLLLDAINIKSTFGLNTKADLNPSKALDELDDIPDILRYFCDDLTAKKNLTENKMIEAPRSDVSLKSVDLSIFKLQYVPSHTENNDVMASIVEIENVEKVSTSMGTKNLIENERSAILRVDMLKKNWDNQIVTKIVSSIKNNVSSIDLILHPKKLGEVAIQISNTENSVAIKLATENLTVANLFQTTENKLDALLSQNGMKLAEFTVGYDNQNRDNRNTQQFNKAQHVAQVRKRSERPTASGMHGESVKLSRHIGDYDYLV